MSTAGVDATTIQQITDAADIGFGTFYNYYDGKDDLAQDVLDCMIHNIGRAQRPDHAAARRDRSGADRRQLGAVRHPHDGGGSGVPLVGRAHRPARRPDARGLRPVRPPRHRPRRRVGRLRDHRRQPRARLEPAQLADGGRRPRHPAGRPRSRSTSGPSSRACCGSWASRTPPQPPPRRPTSPRHPTSRSTSATPSDETHTRRPRFTTRSGWRRSRRARRRRSGSGSG